MANNFSSAARAGSLTPQLEGAARSVPHPVRVQARKLSTQAKKGGARYE